ncbi:MAG: YihY/virulence factor BrkB family protein [Cyclonatronaceae bacterium]
MIRIFKILREIKIVLFATISEWLDDKMMLHAAGLAFYTIFSLAPLIIIIVAVSGYVFGEQATSGQLSGFMEELMGRELALAIENFVSSVYQKQSGGWATLFGVGILLFAATTVITQLKESLNTIWNVTAKEGTSIKMFLVDRALALLFILILASILVLLVMLDATLSVLGPFVDDVIPGGLDIWNNLNIILSMATTTVLFAIIYKMLPDIKVKWSDVWVGAFVTALLFWLGRYLIGIYLGAGTATTAYGAAGSFVIFLIWVYYNAMVVFIGAEFTYIYTTRYGSTVQTRRFVQFVTEEIPSWAVRRPLKRVQKMTNEALSAEKDVDKDDLEVMMKEKDKDKKEIGDDGLEAGDKADRNSVKDDVKKAGNKNT